MLAIFANIIVIITGLLLLASFFSKEIWLADFVVQFYLQITLLCFVFALLMWLLGLNSQSTLQLIYGVFTLLTIITFMFANSLNKYPTQSDIKPITLVSFNIYEKNKNYKAISEIVLKENPDIVYFMETTNESAEFLTPIFEENGFFANAAFHESIENSSLFFSRLQIQDIRAKRLFSGPRYVLYALLEHSKKPLQFYGIHTPSPKSKARILERNNFLKILADYIQIRYEPNNPVIVAGDFNTVPWHFSIQDLLRRAHLLYAQPSNATGTWPAWLPSLFRVPIDHIFYSNYFSVVTTRVSNAGGSDHLPLITKLYFYNK